MTTRRTHTSRTAALLSSSLAFAAASLASAEGRGVNGAGIEARYGVYADDPVVFVWQKPLGKAAADPRIIEFVRESTRRGPEEVADRMVAQILDRGLREGEVAILLQNFGMGHGWPGDVHNEGPALFCHWGDGVAHAPRPESDPTVELLADEDATPKWWYTPWMSDGIATCRDYMERWIARYKQLQAADPRIPDPARFHFDSEERVSAFRNHTTHLFVTMMEDPRWDTEPIPGFGSATLADLYAQAGSPTVNPDHYYHHPVNREWANWYNAVAESANEGGLDAAAYSLIKEAWPDSRSSNYGSSAAADGQGTPRRVIESQSSSWVELWHQRKGQFQAPVYYFTDDSHRLPGESTADLMIRFIESRLPKLVFSHGGPRGDITPWLFNPGQLVTSRPDLRVIDGNYARRQYEMLRAWGIDEMLLWSDDTSQRSEDYWNQLPGALDAVWGPRLKSARLVAGDSEDRRLSLLRRRWNDPAVIQSYGMNQQHLAMIRTTWRTPWERNSAPDGPFRITYVQTDGPQPIIRLRRGDNGRWVEGSSQVDENGRVMIDFPRGAQLLDANGEVTAQVEWRDSRAFEVELDLLMLTAVPDLGRKSKPRSNMRIKIRR